VARGWFQLRATEATPQQLALTGAYGGSGYDPVDNAIGWKRSGAGRREVPDWTRERAVAASIAGYRSNPMATSDHRHVHGVLRRRQGRLLRLLEPRGRQGRRRVLERPPQPGRGDPGARAPLADAVGRAADRADGRRQSGAVRFSPMDPMQIRNVELDRGNVLWPAQLVFNQEDGEERRMSVVQVNDETGLREGEALWWAPWKTVITDTRGMPFLTPVLDWLDSYDTVLSNLIDRTALARYLVWDVTVKGSQPEVDAYIKSRGGLGIPPSGSVEVHNESVTWEPKSAPSGAAEDTQAGSAVLTNIASGAGLAKTWLAEPDGANRATSLTMAEPVRRRVGGLQKVWLAQQTERVRFASTGPSPGRLPKMVEATDPRTGTKSEVPASQTVLVTGPEIAAADAQITAGVLVNLATGLNTMVTGGLLTPPAGAQAARKAWEDFMGIPYKAELDGPT
jgi:hypothetical protein